MLCGFLNVMGNVRSLPSPAAAAAVDFSYVETVAAAPPPQIETLHAKRFTQRRKTKDAQKSVGDPAIPESTDVSPQRSDRGSKMFDCCGSPQNASNYRWLRGESLTNRLMIPNWGNKTIYC
jgi:hypothetical protein